MVALRQDSWAANIPEDKLWDLFYRSRKCKWNECVKYAVAEFGLTEAPSRTSFYAWRKAMQNAEHEHRMSEAIIAQAQAKEIAGEYKITDDIQVRSLMSAAADAALLSNDSRLCRTLISTAMSIKDRQQKDRELDIRQEEQRVAAEKLKLDRERFEFDAAKAAMKKAQEIKNITADNSIDSDEKIALVRKALFGEDAV